VSGSRPRVDTYTVPVRAAAPQAIGIARALAFLFGGDVNGRSGTVRFGYPQIGNREKYQGYANTPQLFTGYDPRKVAAGTFRGAPGALPSTTAPASLLNAPLQRAMATVTAAQLAGQA
jgi:hypothetical protein